MKSPVKKWTLRLLPFACIALMGASCDNNFSGTDGVLGIISAVFQLVVSIISLVD